jgi:hypothetical protein
VLIAYNQKLGGSLVLVSMAFAPSTSVRFTLSLLQFSSGERVADYCRDIPY